MKKGQETNSHPLIYPCFRAKNGSSSIIEIEKEPSVLMNWLVQKKPL